jgi:hypothetical protein
MENRWYLQPPVWLEAFVLVNLGFLAPDIYLAHSTNLFRNWAEYLPLALSLAAPLVLLAAAGLAWRGSIGGWRALGHIVGGGTVALGIAGLILHLESRFFHEATLESLVYTAPFAAPLAYTGLGLLLIMNRMVNPESVEWPLWVLLLALGGFVGNFIFSLSDHAQNGFFYQSEWIPVAASALAVGFLVVPFVLSVNRSYVTVCVVVMGLQIMVGLLGFYLHTAANLRGPSVNHFGNFVYGAPAMAPLLFPNLAVLVFIGLWRLRSHLMP